jgi:hypothetical protein
MPDPAQPASQVHVGELPNPPDAPATIICAELDDLRQQRQSRLRDHSEHRLGAH